MKQKIRIFKYNSTETYQITRTNSTEKYSRTLEKTLKNGEKVKKPKQMKKCTVTHGFSSPML